MVTVTHSELTAALVVAGAAQEKVDRWTSAKMDLDIKIVQLENALADAKHHRSMVENAHARAAIRAYELAEEYDELRRVYQSQGDL